MENCHFYCSFAPRAVETLSTLQLHGDAAPK